MSDTVKTHKHPSYACASFSRTSGKGGALFCAPGLNYNTIRLEISEAELKVGACGVTDVYDEKEIISVEFTEAQLVQLMTQFNRGVGVPCTLVRLMGKTLPGVPQAPNIGESAMERFTEIMQSVAASVKSLLKQTEELAAKPNSAVTAADRKELKETAVTLNRDYINGLPYVVAQFKEALSAVVQEKQAQLAHYAATVAQSPPEPPALTAEEAAKQIVAQYGPDGIKTLIY